MLMCIFIILQGIEQVSDLYCVCNLASLTASSFTCNALGKCLFKLCVKHYLWLHSFTGAASVRPSPTCQQTVLLPS